MAVERGAELGANAIQIFNQNPRQWKPREYSDDEVAAFHAAIADSDVDALLIHAVYLLNCASEDTEIRDKSHASLTSSLQAGDKLKAHCVVLHPGSALKAGGDVDEAIQRAGKVIAAALEESDDCPLHLEDTAGAGGTLGRSFEELARLIEVAGGPQAARRLPRLLPPARLGLRHPHRGRPGRGAGRVRPGHRARPARLAALQRLREPARLEPRPPREPRRRRDRQARHGRVPLRAALRGDAERARGPRPQGQGPRPAGPRVGVRAPQAGARGAQAPEGRASARPAAGRPRAGRRRARGRARPSAPRCDRRPCTRCRTAAGAGRCGCGPRARPPTRRGSPRTRA